MSEQTERNKATVARVFQIFKSGDFEPLGEVIVEDYKQHNPMAANGLEAVKAFFRPVGPLDFEVHRVIAEGDLVAAHVHYRTFNMAAVDIWRFNDEGKIVEHWDVLQTIPETTASGNDMFSQVN